MSSVTSPNDVVDAVGIGPGAPDYLTLRAERLVSGADVVVGFETVVDQVRHLVDGECIACGYDDEAEALGRFADLVADGGSGVAVLAGDPNVSGATFVEKVERAVDLPLRVVPGVSSIQVAAARARTPIEDATYVTLHKRGDLGTDLDRLVTDAGDRHLLVLPRPFDWMPGDVANHLIEHGAQPDLDALVFEHLTLAEEAVDRLPLRELAAHANGDRPEDARYADRSILVVRRADS